MSETTETAAEAPPLKMGLDFEPLPCIKLVGDLVIKAALTGAIALGCLELGLRMAGLPSGSTRSIRSAYDIDGATPGPFKAGAKVKDSWPEETAYSASFNSLGCRGPEPRNVDAPAIVCMGDSITFGLGVEDDETWPAHLDRRLHEEKLDRPVINMACGFLLPEDDLYYAKRALPVIKPGLVILLMQPGGYGEFIDKIERTPHMTSKERERGRRVWPTSWYHRLAIYEARSFGRLWRKKLQLVGSGHWPPSLKGTEEAEGKEAENPWAYLRPRYIERMRELKELTEANGGKLVLVGLPTIVPASEGIRITEPWSRAVAEELGCTYVSLFEPLSAEPNRESLVQYPYDFHFSSKGNSIVAEAVLRVLRDSGHLDSGR